MSTTTTKKPRATQPEAVPMRQLIAQTIAAHSGYHEATEKLRELENKRAQVQSEFDQVNAAAETDVAELADRILAGDELGEREQVFAKRQALAQRVAAYTAAIAKQSAIVAQCRHDAGKDVQAIVEPIYLERFEQLIVAVNNLTATKDAMIEVQQELTSQSVKHGINFLSMQAFDQACKQLTSIVERSKAARQAVG